ncbi:lysophospholipid acyltransferase family protein [Saccharothrix australiensis]|uniref:1-acyl-sn-glycerol-3-phosphate acyltransferase n=1 Tax=Saccharothrix australiensis TaxID=2072 RepID=A0A495W695_9PSEU|nr:lysophospholipid acyltransferase family protein [Saccharothrix australiensis]RKT57182.1 1-acyl-sn-glycerol-3-phosphate acyltransferase [Saccharothrix australiensis]
MTAAHAWMPSSPCGDGCVDRTAAEVGVVRVAWRVCAALAVLACGAPVALAALATRGRTREALLRRWFRLLVRAFGARLSVVGAPVFQATPGRGVLVVSNHVSWLDELAIDAVQPIRMVAKRDIKDWPVLGGLITAARTVYLDRERLSLLPGTVAELTAALRDGAAVGIHAEGTTWCGLASGRYRPALFQAALDAGVPVQPVVLRYLVGGAPTTRAAFVGSDTLVDSLRRVLRLRDLVVEVRVLDEVAPGRAASRRELAALVQRETERTLYGDVLVPAQRAHGGSAQRQSV